MKRLAVSLVYASDNVTHTAVKGEKYLDTTYRYGIYKFRDVTRRWSLDFLEK